VNAFLDRPLDGEWPYLWLDATYLKVRDGGRIVSVAAIIVMALSSDGRGIPGVSGGAAGRAAVSRRSRGAIRTETPARYRLRRPKGDGSLFVEGAVRFGGRGLGLTAIIDDRNRPLKHLQRAQIILPAAASHPHQADPGSPAQAPPARTRDPLRR
jgi:mutator family transposase